MQVSKNKILDLEYEIFATRQGSFRQRLLNKILLFNMVVFAYNNNPVFDLYSATTWINYFLSSPKESRNIKVSIEDLRSSIELHVLETTGKSFFLDAALFGRALVEAGFYVIIELKKIPLVVVNENDFNTLIAVNKLNADSAVKEFESVVLPS